MDQMSNCWERVGWLRIDIFEGCEFPWGYGLAYRKYDCRKAVCYPLGLNWIVWIFREIYFRLVRTPLGTADKIALSFKIGFYEGSQTIDSFDPNFGNYPISMEEYKLLLKSLMDSINKARQEYEQDNNV